jgi:hypothetical protein
VSRPLARRPGRPGATSLKPVLQLLEGVPARSVPYDQLAVHAVASGSRAAPATISGNEAAISVPRLERSTTRPESTETRARNPSHLGSLAHPGRRAGSGTGVASIGSGSVHGAVTLAVGLG